MSRFVLIFAALLGLASALPASAAPTINAAPNRADMAYDDARGLLYLSTSDGKILRYNPTTNTMLPAWTVGVSLRGIDTTPDGNYLLATEGSTGVSQGLIHRIDLNSGSVTNLFYNLDAAGGRDIVALNDGRAIFTSDFNGSGASPQIRSINLSTWAITQMTVNGQGQNIIQNAPLFRSRDRSTVMMVDTWTSAGGLSAFSTKTENYLHSANMWTPLNGLHLAVSPNGADYGISGFNISFSANHTSDFSLINVLAGSDTGIAYDPTGTLLYVARADDNRIHMLRTSDYVDVGSFAAGISLSGVFDENDMTVSGDGKWLFLSSNDTLYTFAISPVPEPASLGVLAVGAVMLLRRRAR